MVRRMDMKLEVEYSRDTGKCSKSIGKYLNVNQIVFDQKNEL